MKALIKDYLDLCKLRLSLMVVMTGAVGVLLQSGVSGLTHYLTAVFLLSLFALVCGACMMNCYIEREIDKKMARTCQRALPAGRIDENHVLALSLIMMIGAIFSLTYFINSATAFLGTLAAVFYLYLYTPLKRKSFIALFVGAIPGAIPPVMGRTAALGEFDLMSAILFAILFIWQIPHFLAISIFYEQDYDRAKIRILPKIKGVAFTKKIMGITTGMLIIVSALPIFLGLESSIYAWVSSFLGTGLLVLALFGRMVEDTGKNNLAWAKGYFWGTIVYLPGILLSMLVGQISP